MDNEFEVVFFSNLNGKEPVREWLSGLSKKEKYEISKDIAKVQIAYPFKMPLVKSLGGGIFEIRSKLPNKISRIFFCLKGRKIVLLHAFIKKTQEIPQKELNIVKERYKLIKGE
jgi:phage-related protein